MLQDELVSKTGEPLAGGIISMFADGTMFLKRWYYQTGTMPNTYEYTALPNPMTLSAAGTMVDQNGNDIIPFYYPWDESDATGNTFQAYTVLVQDSNQTDQFTRYNFPWVPGQNGPLPPFGPGSATNKNLIKNGRFWRNIGTYNTGTNPLPNSTTILGINSNNPIFYVTVAPDQHDGYILPDITFQKGSNSGTDTITFTKFAQGFAPFQGPPTQTDITPEFYINHTSSAQGGQTYKVYNFPVSLHQQTLEQTNATVTIQAMSTIGSSLTLSILAFAGSGATSSMPLVVLTIPVLDPTWTQYKATFTFQTTSGVTLSAAGDDAYYLQVGLSPAAAVNVNFALPSIYLSPTVPVNDFSSYDEINTIISSPRTGDIRATLNTFMPYGWVPLNDGTISNPLGSASTLRSNACWPLYNLIWNSFQQFSTGTSASGTNPIAQMYNPGGTTAIGYGTAQSTTALSDFTIGNQLALTGSMGAVIMGTVPLSTILQNSLLGPYVNTVNVASDVFTPVNAPGTIYFIGMPIYFPTTAPTGPLTINTPYYITLYNGTTFQLAISFANAVAAVAITGSTNGGPFAFNTLQYGSFAGEYGHLQLLTEIAQHQHNPLSPGTGFIMNSSSSHLQIGSGQNSSTVTTTGGVFNYPASQAQANVVQPYTLYNMFMKL
ncbi:MAG TPA: hypothetical protein VNW51_08935 [Mucilaginibacter sp.]|nr:hypothetical protein [Mucilaginibacter sp.]